jgi:hypothetical protein
MNKDFESSERADRMLVASIVNSVAKCGFYIAVCAIAGMLFSTCKVDKETIIQCEESCGSSRGIDEVSSWSCTCNEPTETLESPWVLPKK